MRNIQANLELILIAVVFSILLLATFILLMFLKSKFLFFSGWLPVMAFLALATMIFFYHRNIIRKYSPRFFNHVDNSPSLKDTMNLNWYESDRVKKYAPFFSYYIFSSLLLLILHGDSNKFGKAEINIFFIFIPLYSVTFYIASRWILNHLYTPKH